LGHSTVEAASNDTKSGQLSAEEAAKIREQVKNYVKKRTISKPHKKIVLSPVNVGKGRKEKKKNRVSFSTSYSDKWTDNVKVEGKTANLSISRKISKTETIFGYAFGAMSHTTSSGNEFNGDSLGFGGGYAYATGSGFVLTASGTYSNSQSSGLTFLTSRDITGTHSKTYGVSLGVSKPIVINSQIVVTPSISYGHTIGNEIKGSTTISPKVTVAGRFNDKFSGSTFVGISGSPHKKVTLSRRKVALNLGLGANYLITDRVSVGTSFTHERSGGNYQGNTGRLSIAAPF